MKKKRIEFIDDVVKFESETVQMTESFLKEMIKNRGISVLADYEVPESFILSNLDIFDKESLIQGVTLSEDFIVEALEIGYFTEGDIKNLSMSTHVGLSKTFLKAYSDHINWNKIILYIISSEQDFSLDKYLNIIEKYNLWSIVSLSGSLPISFIRDYKDKLDWKNLSLTQNFTSDEAIEFSDYIVDVRSEPPTENFDFNFNLVPFGINSSPN